MSDRVDECLRIACGVSSSAVKIYNLIREVGYKNSLPTTHYTRWLRKYHNLNVFSDRLTNLAKTLEEGGGEK